jgi:hypothetical protein
MYRLPVHPKLAISGSPDELATIESCHAAVKVARLFLFSLAAIVAPSVLNRRIASYGGKL